MVIPGYQLRGFPFSYETSIPRGLPATNGSSDSHVNGLTNGHTNGYTNCCTNGYKKGCQAGDDHLPSVSWCTQTKIFRVKQAGVRPFVLLPLSAHDERALKLTISKVSASLGDFDLADLLYTLSRRRTTFSRRAFAVAESQSLVNVLDSRKITFGKAPSSVASRIGFVFTGQGAQWPQSEYKPSG